MLTFICSPYRGDTARNVAYARRAMLDSIRRGEVPVVPHLLYTQVLSDEDTNERRLGMFLGEELLKSCHYIAVYEDYGISSGMSREIHTAQTSERIIFELRSIGPNP